MTAAVAGDPQVLGQLEGTQEWSNAEGGPAAKRIVVAYGFWIFLLSDIVMFSAFFAAYAVLSGETAGGPSGRDLFDLNNVGARDRHSCCHRASPAAWPRSVPAPTTTPCIYGGMAATFLLGAGFLFLELREFSGLLARAPALPGAPFCPPSSPWSAAMGCT